MSGLLLRQGGHCFRCDVVSVVGLSGGLLRGRVRLLTEIGFEQA